MIQKYLYGVPFDTESVVAPIPASQGEPPVGTVKTSESGFCFACHLAEGDRVYGLGEANRGINKRGFVYVSDNVDDGLHTENKQRMYAAHNFIVISGQQNLGLFFDYPARIRFDIGFTRRDWLEVTCERADLALYVITGDSACDVVKQFRAIIGRSYIPPKFAFGFGQSRYGYKTQADFEEVVAKHRQAHIPLDMVYMDIDYMDHYKDFTVNPENFPDFSGFVSKMKEQGVRLVPIIDAGVKEEAGYSVCDEGKEKGYFCKRADGTDFEGTVWPGWSHFPDVLNPEARAWFGSQYKALTDCGIEGFWNDMNEPAIFYSREGLASIAPGKRFLLFSRSSCIGMHRYGGVWTGDNHSWWSHLLLNLKMLPSLNMCGFLYVGADLGGFNADTSRDLLLRWLALGVFTPLMRNHSGCDTRRQEFYQFEGPEDFRSVIETRYRLIPYLYSEYMKAALNGDMLFKPLAFVYPEDEIALQTEDQLMLGNEVMIAPVYTQNATGRMVYLPEEMLFVKFGPEGRITQEVLPAGTHFVKVALNEVPLFIRKGACIPVADPAQTVADSDPATIRMIGWPGASYDRYDDDGVTIPAE